MLRNRLAGAATVGAAVLAAVLTVAPAANAATVPSGSPRWFIGHVEQVRNAGSDTTFFVMQKLSDYYNQAALYGCNLQADNATCNTSGDIPTTNTSDNYDRVELTEGIDAVGSGAGMNQLCGLSAVPTGWNVDFARSSKAPTGCTDLVGMGFAKDGVPAVDFPGVNPSTWGTASAFSGVNSGNIGPVAAGWEPGNPTNGTANSGVPFVNLTKTDSGGGSNSVAYRIYCATDSSRITDWGQLTNLSQTAQITSVNVTDGSPTATVSSGGFGSAAANDVVWDGIAGGNSNIPLGQNYVQSVSGNTLTLAYPYEDGSFDGAAATDVLTFRQPVGSGTSIGLPINVIGVNPSSGTNSTFTTFVTGTSSTACNSNINTQGSVQINGVSQSVSVVSGSPTMTISSGTFPGTIVPGMVISAVGVNNGPPPTTVVSNNGTTLTMSENASASKGPEAAGFTSGHIALENNAAQIGDFLSSDYPGNFPNQAVGLATSLYYMSNGVYTTSKFSRSVQIGALNGSGQCVGGPPSGCQNYSAILVAEESRQPGVSDQYVATSSNDILEGTYPTARILYNVYRTGTLRASTAGVLDWICQTNGDSTGINKGKDLSTGQNYDSEITNAINTQFGFFRLTDKSTAPNNVCNLIVPYGATGTDVTWSGPTLTSTSAHFSTGTNKAHIGDSVWSGTNTSGTLLGHVTSFTDTTITLDSTPGTTPSQVTVTIHDPNS